MAFTTCENVKKLSPAARVQETVVRRNHLQKRSIVSIAMLFCWMLDLRATHC